MMNIRSKYFFGSVFHLAKRARVNLKFVSGLICYDKLFWVMALTHGIVKSTRTLSDLNDRCGFTRMWYGVILNINLPRYYIKMIFKILYNSFIFYSSIVLYKYYMVRGEIWHNSFPDIARGILITNRMIVSLSVPRAMSGKLLWVIVLIYYKYCLWSKLQFLSILWSVLLKGHFSLFIICVWDCQFKRGRSLFESYLLGVIKHW